MVQQVRFMNDSDWYRLFEVIDQKMLEDVPGAKILVKDLGMNDGGMIDTLNYNKVHMVQLMAIAMDEHRSRNGLLGQAIPYTKKFAEWVHTCHAPMSPEDALAEMQQYIFGDPKFYENRLWTETEEDSLSSISSGWHYVNRNGYYLSEIPHIGEFHVFDKGLFPDCYADWKDVFAAVKESDDMSVNGSYEEIEDDYEHRCHQENISKACALIYDVLRSTGLFHNLTVDRDINATVYPVVQNAFDDNGVKIEELIDRVLDCNFPCGGRAHYDLPEAVISNDENMARCINHYIGSWDNRKQFLDIPSFVSL